MDDVRSAPHGFRGRTLSPALLTVLLGALLFASMLGAASVGAVHISAAAALRALFEPFGVDASGVSESTRAILFDVRLPRVVLAALVGAVLSMSGAAIQGLFKNALAEPGLVGVSAGGSLGAALVIVLAAPIFAVAPAWLRPALLPIGAFFGSLVVTLLVLRVGTVGGEASALMMILAGIAVNAFVGAAIGLAAYWASDRELRDLVFWMLGSFANATRRAVLFVAPALVVPLVVLPRFGKALNLLALGDLEARRLGVNVARDKRVIIVLVALGVGASVSATGLIGFVGLVVPHIVRLVIGPDNRRLLVMSALLGGSLVVLGDTAARTLVAPLELPIGVLTALLGGPTFFVLLLRARRSFSS